MNTDTVPTVNTIHNPVMRDERGLLKGISYTFRDDGTVDYKALLKPEHLYINCNKWDKEKVTQLEKKYGKRFDDLTIKDVEDRDLCVTLTGLKYVAAIRGFKSDKRTVNHITYDPHYQVVAACTVTSEITWIPNFETNYETVITTDIAGASLNNCHSFAQRYCEAIASNRALARCIRGFLGGLASIVSREEIGPDGDLKLVKPEESIAPSGNQPSDLIEQRVKTDWNLTFEQFKKAITAKYKDAIKNPDYAKLEKNPDEWASYKTIPNNDIFLLLGLLKKAKEEKGK